MNVSTDEIALNTLYSDQKQINQAECQQCQNSNRKQYIPNRDDTIDMLDNGCEDDDRNQFASPRTTFYSESINFLHPSETPLHIDLASTCSDAPTTVKSCRYRRAVVGETPGQVLHTPEKEDGPSAEAPSDDNTDDTCTSPPSATLARRFDLLIQATEQQRHRRASSHTENETLGVARVSRPCDDDDNTDTMSTWCREDDTFEGEGHEDHIANSNHLNITAPRQSLCNDSTSSREKQCLGNDNTDLPNPENESFTHDEESVGILSLHAPLDHLSAHLSQSAVTYNDPMHSQRKQLLQKLRSQLSRRTSESSPVISEGKRQSETQHSSSHFSEKGHHTLGEKIFQEVTEPHQHVTIANGDTSQHSRNVDPDNICNENGDNTDRSAKRSKVTEMQSDDSAVLQTNEQLHSGKQPQYTINNCGHASRHKGQGDATDRGFMNLHDSKPLILITAVSDSVKKRAMLVFKKIGVNFLAKSDFIPEATHLICGTPTRSEKFLAACARGLWVVRPDYIEACAMQNCLVSEAAYEWISSSSSAKDIASAPRRWRLKLAKLQCEGTKPFGAFDTWTVVLFTRPTMYASFRRLLVGGGAIVLDPSTENVHAFLQVTHVFVESSLQTVPGLRRVFESCSQNTLFLRPEYLSDFLIREISPDCDPDRLAEVKLDVNKYFTPKET